MDYKKLIRNAQMRYAILRALSWIPDGIMVRLQYRIKMGFFPNLRSPQRYTEKLQYYKLHYRNPLMHTCVDKYNVREYVRSKGLGDILNDCYGVYKSADEIDFDRLPQSFVLKTTHGGGGRNILIVKDKSKCNIPDIKANLLKWQKEDIGNFGREWAYTGLKKRFITEKYIDADINKGGLIDYKFFCFNGEVHCLYVIADRELGDKAGLAVYDRTFSRLKVSRADEKILERDIEKPVNFDKMIAIAETLSTDFPHVRIDLYNVSGKIIFGEFTFYDGSGYMRFNPDSFDYELGKHLSLEDIKSSE